MGFDEVWGHSYPKKVLASLVKTKKLPKALLITGPIGVGKKTVAWAFIKELMEGARSLENCVDLLHLTPEGKNGEYRRAQIDQIVRFTQVKPSQSFTKVCLIEDAQGLGELLTNSLLKTVEEPVSRVLFILLAQGENALIPTLVSRTVKLQLSPLSKSQVQSYLEDQGVKGDEAENLAKRSDGCIGKAKAFMEQNSKEIEDLSFDLGKALYGQEVLTSVDLCKKVEKHVQEGAVTAASFLQTLTTFFKDLYILQEGIDKELFFGKEKMQAVLGKRKVDLNQTARSYHETQEQLSMHLPIKTAVPYKIWA
jgi:DNA polymerase III subunit delta'